MLDQIDSFGTISRRTSIISSDSKIYILLKPSSWFKNIFKSGLKDRYQTIRSMKSTKNFYNSGLVLQHYMYRDDIEEMVYSCLCVPEHIDFSPFFAEYGIPMEDMISVEVLPRIAYNSSVYKPFSYFGGKFGSIRINGINYTEFDFFVDRLSVPKNLTGNVQIIYQTSLTPDQNLDRLAEFVRIKYNVNIKLPVNA